MDTFCSKLYAAALHVCVIVLHQFRRNKLVCSNVCFSVEFDFVLFPKNNCDLDLNEPPIKCMQLMPPATHLVRTVG
jgi:hypothetical protein